MKPAPEENSRTSTPTSVTDATETDTEVYTRAGHGPAAGAESGKEADYCECTPEADVIDPALSCGACGKERMMWEDLEHRRGKMTELLKKILSTYRN